MSPPPFSIQDAQMLVNLASSASLPNLAAAEQVQKLLARFADFANFHLTPQVPSPQTAGKGKAK